MNSNGSLPCVSVDGLIFDMMLSEKVTPMILGSYMTVCETRGALSSPEMRPAMNPSFWFRGSSDACPVLEDYEYTHCGRWFQQLLPHAPKIITIKTK